MSNYKYYNLRRKLIKAIETVMLDEGVDLLTASLLVKGVANDAVDVIRNRYLNASGCLDEEGAEYHRAIIGEHCVHCGEQVI